MRRIRWKLLAWCMGILVATAGLATLAPARAHQDDAAFSLTIGTALCDAEPTSGLANAACRAAPGITVRVLAEDGTALGACVTGGADPAMARCTVPVPYDTRLLIYEDETTVPPGYGPRANPLSAVSPTRGVSSSETQDLLFVNLPRTAPGTLQQVPVIVAAYACPNPAAALDTCDALSGVAITVEIDGVEMDGSPLITSRQEDGSQAAIFVAPPDATLTLTESSGLPDGLVPEEESAPRVVDVADLERRACDRPVLCAFVALINVPTDGTTPAASPEAPITPTASPTQTGTAMAGPAPQAIAVHVHAGTCARLAKSPRYDLPDLVIAGPPTEGAAEASPAIVSAGAVDLSLDDLLAAPHAINLHLRSLPGEMIVACGEIGGTRLADGSLAFGLREMLGSGYMGVAHLVPDSNGDERTHVTVYLAAHLAEAARGVAPGDGTGGPTTAGSTGEDIFVPTHQSNPDLAVNFRPAPSLDTVPVAILDPGTLIQFLGETVTDADGWRWYRFRLEDGRTGWLREGTFIPLEEGEGT